MRLIDADTLTEHIIRLEKSMRTDSRDVWNFNLGYNEGLLDAKCLIKISKTIDAEHVRHGRWIKPALGDGENSCSVCGTSQPWAHGYGYFDYDFCPILRCEDGWMDVQHMNKIAESNEEMYQTTPKGLAWLALSNVGLVDDTKDVRFNAFWILFKNYMKEAGYVVEED